MKIDFFQTKTLDQTRERILLHVNEMHQGGKVKTEWIGLADSLGRYVAKEIYSKENLPPFSRSTVDGYAVIVSDIQGASEGIPSFLNLKATVKMGEDAKLTLQKGECIYVPTGGMIPEGTQAMVKIEYTEKVDEEMILFYKAARTDENITYLGDDVRVNDLILEVGTRITPYHIGLLAGMGIPQVQVYGKPTFAILSTGDEIIDIHEEKVLGQIRDINGYSIAAWIVEQGGEVVWQTRIKDQMQALQDGMEHALSIADCILLSGGSSMGNSDFTSRLISDHPSGELWVHGMAVNPGKPTIVGKIYEVLVVGLPGHPVSALMNCRHLISTYFEGIFKIQRDSFWTYAKLTDHVRGSAGKETYQLVQLEMKEEQWSAKPIFSKSGIMSTLSIANGYFIIGRDCEGVEKGKMIKVFLLHEVRI